MGNTWQRIVKRFHNQEVRILMVGLDAAGKTTTLYKLKLGEVVTTIPTIGFNVETVTYKGTDFVTWDIGGRDKSRPLWRHYYQNTSVIIFVIDSNDRERIDECKDELWRFLKEDELKDTLLLVLANKQDLPNAMSTQEVTEKLGLNTIRDGRSWYIQGACATSGDGLYEGLSWVSDTLTQQRLKKAIIKPIKQTLPFSKDDGLNKKASTSSSWWSTLSSYLVGSTA